MDARLSSPGPGLHTDLQSGGRPGPEPPRCSRWSRREALQTLRVRALRSAANTGASSPGSGGEAGLHPEGLTLRGPQRTGHTGDVPPSRNCPWAPMSRAGAGGAAVVGPAEPLPQGLQRAESRPESGRGTRPPLEGQGPHGANRTPPSGQPGLGSAWGRAPSGPQAASTPAVPRGGTRGNPHLHLDGNHHGDELLLQLLEDHQLLQGQAAQPARAQAGSAAAMHTDAPAPHPAGPPSTLVTRGDGPCTSRGSAQAQRWPCARTPPCPTPRGPPAPWSLVEMGLVSPGAPPRPSQAAEAVGPSPP